MRMGKPQNTSMARVSSRHFCIDVQKKLMQILRHLGIIDHQDGVKLRIEGVVGQIVTSLNISIVGQYSQPSPLPTDFRDNG